MNIIAVDDEKLSLEALVAAIKDNLPKETINAFRRTTDAEVFVCRNGCDIAFLDIEMRDVNGITLAKKTSGNQSEGQHRIRYRLRRFYR